MEVTIDFKPKRFQRELIDAVHSEDVRRIVLLCARQTGKSYVLRYVILEWLLTKADCKIMYCCTTLRLARKFFQDLADMMPEALVSICNMQNLTLKLKNRAFIQFVSAETAQNVRGLSFNYGILDEYSFHRATTPNGQLVWENCLMPTFDAYLDESKIIFCSTPFGVDNNFYTEYCRAKNNTKGYKLIKCSIYEDETKSEEFIKEKRELVSNKVFRQEYECEFLQTGISYFTNIEECATNDGFYANENNRVYYAGIDLSYSQNEEDADRTIVTLISQTNYVFQHLITGTLDERYDKIANILNKCELKDCYIEKNGAGDVIINEIKKRLDPKKKFLVKPWNTTNESKIEIITELARAMEKMEPKYCNDHDLKEELRCFVEKRTATGKQTFSALPGHHDDRVMSLAIAWRCKQDNTTNKRSMGATLVKRR